MNILYICHYAGSPKMGMSFRMYYLAKEWQKMGHTVRIVAGDYSHLRIKNPRVKKDFTTNLIDGIKYTWIKTGKYEGNGIKRAITMFRFVSKLWYHAKGLAKAWKPDVVITSSTYPLDTFAGQKIAKYANAKYIHEVHDMWPATLYEIGGMSKTNPFVVIMQIAENSAYKHCDELVALLPNSKGYMIKHGLKPYKFHNLQNGVVEEEWREIKDLPQEHKELFDRLKDKFIVAHFGGHALSNALDLMLDVAKNDNDHDIVYVLVGDGIEKPRLIERKEREHLENVFFLPPVEKTMIPSLVKNCDCSYMGAIDSPLYKYGLCMNKMYDSMMAGTPIICAINAENTLVEQYNCGFMVDPSDINTILDGIHRLKNMTQTERDAIGNNGKKAILEHFTYKKIAEQFSELF